MAFKDYANFHHMLADTVDQCADLAAFEWFDDNGSASSVTWQAFYGQMKQVSKSLMALGLAHGDKVNILSSTCYPWVLTDFANMSVGVCTVGIYQSNLPQDCQYIIDHCDGVLVFAEDRIQLDKLVRIRSEIPAVRNVVLFNGDCPEDDWVLSWDEFLALGQGLSDEAFDGRVNQVTAKDTAGIVYTSGTTGVPKGVVLTHDNLTFTCQSVFHCARFVTGEVLFLFLPLAHVFARLGSYAAVRAGNRIAFSRGIDTLLDDFSLAAPHWFISVPRVFEKIHTKIVAQAEAKGGAALKIFTWACDVAARVSELQLAKKPVPMLLALQYRIAFILVFSKIHKALGGRVKWCISGAAPLNPDIGKFFHGAGLLILEGLGMTENTSFSNVNRPDDYRFGVVGPPGDGIEQRILEDGEVVFKGRNVMKEYYKMPGKTAETFTPDGWLKTGDLGTIEDNNVLRITGRKKELIITAGGKNIAPARIEGVMTTSKYINQCCVVGDRRKYLAAVVTLDRENVMAWAREHNISHQSFQDLLNHQKVQQLIDGEVARINKTLASFETIKKVALVPEFTVENEMMTPTFKLKKEVIFSRFKPEIETLFV